MKKISYILLALIVAVLFFVLINRTDENAASKTDIEKVRQEFRSQFGKVLTELDSVKAELRTANKKIDELKADTDTLKQGEAIIYNEVKKANDKTIWDFFK
jgi:peptidoglycan hydrolase CwlO-like protein